MASLGIQLGAEGLAAIKYTTDFFEFELGGTAMNFEHVELHSKTACKKRMQIATTHFTINHPSIVISLTLLFVCSQVSSIATRVFLDLFAKHGNVYGDDMLYERLDQVLTALFPRLAMRRAGNSFVPRTWKSVMKNKYANARVPSRLELTLPDRQVICKDAQRIIEDENFCVHLLSPVVDEVDKNGFDASIDSEDTVVPESREDTINKESTEQQNPMPTTARMVATDTAGPAVAKKKGSDILPSRCKPHTAASLSVQASSALAPKTSTAAPARKRIVTEDSFDEENIANNGNLPAAAKKAASAKPASKAKKIWMIVPKDYQLSDEERVKACFYAAEKKAPYGCSSFKGRFYPGKVALNVINGTINVHYDDGALEENVLAEHIKVFLPQPEPTSPII